MKGSYLFLVLIVFDIVVTTTGCKKSQPDNQLPPETQTGQNTFGALVNSNVWVPIGNKNTLNPGVQFDEANANGTLIIVANRNPDTLLINSSSLGFVIESLNKYSYPHTFNLSSTGRNDLNYESYTCNYDTSDPSSVSEASITISKLDIPNGIVSGTFFGTLSKNGCPDITITDGRFDIKMY